MRGCMERAIYVEGDGIGTEGEVTYSPDGILTVNSSALAREVLRLGG